MSCLVQVLEVEKGGITTAGIRRQLTSQDANAHCPSSIGLEKRILVLLEGASAKVAVTVGRRNPRDTTRIQESDFV